LIIIAAHLIEPNVNIGVHIAGVVLPANVLKQGAFEDTDLSLLMIDEGNVPAGMVLPQVVLCDAPSWPGDEVIVVDAERAAPSRIVSSQI
jgi:hypothetical protein